MVNKNKNIEALVEKPVIDIIIKYIKILPKDLQIKKVYLFGSRARGVGKEDSDIDIAVVFGNMQDFFVTQIQLMRLRRDIDLRIEPHPIKESDFNEQNPFACEIQRTGIEIEYEEEG